MGTLPLAAVPALHLNQVQGVSSLQGQILNLAGLHGSADRSIGSVHQVHAGGHHHHGTHVAHFQGNAERVLLSHIDFDVASHMSVEAGHNDLHFIEAGC